MCTILIVLFLLGTLAAGWSERAQEGGRDRRTDFGYAEKGNGTRRQVWFEDAFVIRVDVERQFFVCVRS